MVQERREAFLPVPGNGPRVCGPALVTRLPGSVSGPCFAVPHSFWSHRFPPSAPPRRAPPCSPTSSVLSVSLTAPSRSSSAMTSGLPVAAPRTASQGGDGALPVPVREAYVHARVPDDAGWYGCSRYRIRPCCLLLPRRHWHPGLHCFRRSQPGLHTPLSTLRVTPRGATCMTRGRCGSLPLHRSGLSPPTSCRSPGALRLSSSYYSSRDTPVPHRHYFPHRSSDTFRFML